MQRILSRSKVTRLHSNLQSLYQPSRKFPILGKHLWAGVAIITVTSNADSGAADGGGGLAIDPGATSHVERCTFSDLWFSYGEDTCFEGGAMYVEGALTVTNAFLVTNSGDDRVEIGGVSTSGTGEAVSEVRNMPDAVMQNKRSNFAIAYTPAVVGVYTATVEIVNSSTGTPYVLYVQGISYLTNTNNGILGGGNRLVLTNVEPKQRCSVVV